MYHAEKTKSEGEESYTLDDAIEHFGFGSFQIKVILIAGLSWMADAMEMMVLSILSPVLMCEWNLTTFKEALITTMVFLGQGIGSYSWGFASDKFGRKKALYLSVSLVLFFGILSSQAPSYVWILLLRLLVGFGIGGVPQAVTIVTELLPSSSRGRSIVFLEFFWAIGSVFAAAIAISAMSSLNWRWYLILITLPMLLFMVTGIWLPESPRFLMTTGKNRKVLDLLERISKSNKVPMPKGVLVTGEINTKRGRIFDLFTKEWRKTTALLWIIWFTSAFAYYGIVLLTTEIFQTGLNGCHPNKNDTNTITTCKELSNKDYVDFMLTSIAEFPGLLLAIILIEWIGRKKTLAVLFGLASISFMLLAICTGRTMSVIFIFAVRGFVTGSFQAAYVYTPEVLPTNVRAVGLGACSMFARVGAMATPFVAQVLIHHSFYLVVGVYAALLVACVIASLLLPIETKGKTLSDSTHSSNGLEMRTRDGYQSFK
ncbi:synaptic vesicle 2-related protein-like isoform X2 [Hydractinia symbiolongicarpus]|uniref:synaptic vesicle 2-related protein-like isoform X2 n=1 Tax=Hydractinia symbiolongicarpus TaxID=13093 RepID=UPI0025513142|nr:synaptic vesicle 2-related protein-like isoform X2 [Hydractinia symbiolongicarpus]